MIVVGSSFFFLLFCLAYSPSRDCLELPEAAAAFFFLFAVFFGRPRRLGRAVRGASSSSSSSSSSLRKWLRDADAFIINVAFCAEYFQCTQRGTISSGAFVLQKSHIPLQ